MKVELIVQQKSGKYGHQICSSLFSAKTKAKMLLSGNYKQFLWIGVICDDVIEFEYLDGSYGETLDILFGNRRDNVDYTIQDQKNSLSKMSQENPILFDKYLEYLGQNKEVKLLTS